MTTITSDTRTQSDYCLSSATAQAGRHLADSEALALAAAWQGPGPIGHVLAQLASTGQADDIELLDDIAAASTYYAQHTDHLSDFAALTRWTRAKMTGHGLRVGDIFAHSWGYDQRNCDFFEVTAVSPKSVVVREIHHTETSDGSQTMTGKVTPNAGDWKGEAKRRRIKNYDGEPVLKIADGSAHATPWDGQPERVSHYA